MKNWLLIACVAAFAIGCSGGDKGTETTGDTGGAPANSSTTGTTGETSSSTGATTASYIDVQEIFNKSCIGCHGDKNPKENLDLTSYESLMKGSENGPVVVAGDPEKSRLVMALHGTGGIDLMPKGGGGPLADDQIKKVETWIKDGAKKEP